jgi:ApaG protein
MTTAILDALFAEFATTDGVTVRVSPEFLLDQSLPAQGRWFWAYHIRIENHRDDPVQLLTRHWKITDARGMINHVDGDGVVGEQPLLKPGQSHDYVSGCPLGTPTGTMEGHYRFVRADGSTFLVEIPRFKLLAPATAR